MNLGAHVTGEVGYGTPHPSLDARGVGVCCPWYKACSMAPFSKADIGIQAGLQSPPSGRTRLKAALVSSEAVETPADSLLSRDRERRKRAWRLLYYSFSILLSSRRGGRFQDRAEAGLAKYFVSEGEVPLKSFAPTDLQAAMLPLFLGPGAPPVADGQAPEISIVIPVFNHAEYTLACLACIARWGSSFSFETIVVDDGSSDATAEILQRLTWVKVLRASGNQGFLQSCNDGLRAARGRYIVFLNNDTRVENGWLDELRWTFDRRKDAGLVGSKLVFPDGRLQEAGGVITSDGSCLNFGRTSDPDRPEFNYLREVDYVSGASIMLPAALLRELGGFDPYYTPAYYEDTDLAMRVRQAGRSVLYQPLSVVVHYEGITSGTDLNTGVKAHQVTNRERFLERWRGVLASDHARRVLPEPRRRLLIVDATIPTPDRDAGSSAILEVVMAAQADGYQVTFVPENLEGTPHYETALKRRGVELFIRPYCRSVESHLAEFGSRYDAVLVHRVTVAWPILRFIRKYAPGARFLFMPADLHHLREERRGGLEADGRVAQNAGRIKAREIAVVSGADCTLVHSTFERDYLRSLVPGKSVEVLGWVQRRGPMGRLSFDERADLMFIGSFGHPPNADAVEFFLRDVWPKVAAALPEARFLVVGSDPPAAWRTLGAERVEILGHVHDLNPHLQRIRLTVAPLRYGAGVKGKIAVSLGSGVPVVTTSIGAEGMGLTDGENVVVAENADAFAEKVIALYSDGDLWRRLSAQGLAFVDEHFAEAKAGEVVRRALEGPPRN